MTLVHARLQVSRATDPTKRHKALKTFQSGLGGNDETEIVYSDITDAKFVFRMGGSVGDMVLTLRDGAKLEMRHVPEFNKIYKFISEKVDDQCRATMQEMTGMADMDPLPETLMTASG